MPTENILIDGAAGAIDTIVDIPAEIRGIGLVGHPHPLFGGANTNKVTHALARAFTRLDYVALRPNFRGVGSSDGIHDEGRGETDDMLVVLAEARRRFGDLPVALAGFSFGAFVTSHGAARLQPDRLPEQLVLVGTAASRFEVAPVSAELKPRTLVVHGETDDVVPLASVLDWARPQSLPVTVVPGVGHFFHGQLPLLKNIVLHHLHAAH